VGPCLFGSPIELALKPVRSIFEARIMIQKPTDVGQNQNSSSK